MRPWPSPVIDRRMVPAKLFYFLYYGAAASLLPFIVIYYKHLGLSGGQIGVLTGIIPLIALFSAPLWGGVADATNRHRLLLTLAVGGTMAAVALLSTVSSFLPFIPVVVAYAFFSASIVPLVDNTVMEMLGKRNRNYGKQRLWGAIGWGVSAAVIGWITDQAGLHWIFTGYLLLLAATLLVVYRLPVERTSIRKPFWRALRLLMVNRRLALFLLTVFAVGIGLGLVSTYLFLYLDDLGASRSIMGLSLAVATISELPVYFFADRLLHRWGHAGLLSFGILAFTVRAFSYSSMGAVWVVLLIQLLHGPSFSAIWSAGVSYAHELAPEGLGATAQGLFSGVLLGLGAATAGFCGGILYDAIGPAAMFRWASAGGLLTFVLLMITIRQSQQAVKDPGRTAM